MTGGRDLIGGTPDAPRRRGRPPGSKNRRAKDLASYLDVTCGGTAALQLAKECMVTVREARAAGSPEAALVAKARRTVDAFEAERARMNGQLRTLVREELEACFVQAAGLENRDDVRKLVARAVERIEGAAGGPMTLRAALDRLDENRRAILPYTDQKQPMIVAAPPGQAPVMVFMGGSPEAIPAEQNQQVIEAAFVDVTPGSHTPDEKA